MKNNIEKSYLLIGSPNVGKSTFYNKITWKISPVGNIDRVTTSALKANLRADKRIQIIDLPGVCSLDFCGDDEREAFKYIFEKPSNDIINIVNATTLKRDLFLTYELAEAGCLSYLIVNMIDELNTLKLNKLNLSKEFKILIQEISAKKNINVKSSLVPILTNQLKKKSIVIKYNRKIEEFISASSKYIPKHHLSKRFLIIQALNGNEIVTNFLKENNVLDKFCKLVKKFNINNNDILSIKRVKRKNVNKLLNKIYIHNDNLENNVVTNNTNIFRKSKIQLFLDKLFLNPIYAIPIFILIIAFIYFITFFANADENHWFQGGGWIQAKFADVALGGLANLINESIVNYNPSDALTAWGAAFVSEGVLGGIFTIIGFIPWIVILTISVTILEQLGVLSRMSIVFDKVFEKQGISGRAIINLITGIGCNIPGILMAKNANSVKERIVTTMIMPFVGCSARILVFAFISQSLMGVEYTWIFNLGMTIFSILFALSIGYFFSNILFRKQTTLFISEVPKFRSPDFIVVIKKTIFEVYDFVKRTILIVGICSLIIWILSFTGPTKQFYLDVEDINLENSFLRYLTYPLQYLMYPILGEQWKLSVSLLSSFPAKEIAASNIEILYGGPELLRNSLTFLPISTILAFVVFISFYIPCLATLVVMWKQIGWKYTLIHIISSLSVSYIMSIVIFTISGSIETYLINNNLAILLSCSIILGICLFLSIIYRIFNEIKFNKNLIWNTKEIKFYKLFNIANIIISSTTLISLNVTLFLQ